MRRYVARLLIGAARDISRAEKKIRLLHLIKKTILGVIQQLRGQKEGEGRWVSTKCRNLSQPNNTGNPGFSDLPTALKLHT